MAGTGGKRIDDSSSRNEPPRPVAGLHIWSHNHVYLLWHASEDDDPDGRHQL